MLQIRTSCGTLRSEGSYMGPLPRGERQGGGTGSGAAPVSLACLAKQALDCLSPKLDRVSQPRLRLAPHSSVESKAHVSRTDRTRLDSFLKGS